MWVLGTVHRCMHRCADIEVLAERPAAEPRASAASHKVAVHAPFEAANSADIEFLEPLVSGKQIVETALVLAPGPASVGWNP